MMDRLLTAGLCGNTIGQDIQTLTYSSTSNMAFHLKDVCSSNFTWPREMCAIEVFVWKRVCCRTGSGALTCSSWSFLVIQIKVA